MVGTESAANGSGGGLRSCLVLRPKRIASQYLLHCLSQPGIRTAGTIQKGGAEFRSALPRRLMNLLNLSQAFRGHGRPSWFPKLT